MPSARIAVSHHSDAVQMREIQAAVRDRDASAYSSARDSDGWAKEKSVECTMSVVNTLVQTGSIKGWSL